VVAGVEACDDQNTRSGDGCSATCAVERGFSCSGGPSSCATTCGDGIVAGAEACDDGNTTSLDGCSATCRVDAFDEVEPNDATAQANGPYAPGFVFRGALTPATDVDTASIVLTSVSDLTLETTDEGGVGSCLNADTVLTLLGPDGTTVIATDDDSGTNRCSLLTSKTQAALRRLPPGTYFARVAVYVAWRLVPHYRLRVTFDASCGDGATTGSEQCDGQTGCSATCARVPTCGDGFVDGSETCDDHNRVAGDGCSATCALEPRAPVEPNDTAATAQGPYAPDVLLTGAISPSSDVDVYAITLGAVTDLKITTSDASGTGSCVGLDTVVTLLQPDGTTVLLQRDQGGVGSCGAIDPAKPLDAAARGLPAGTYFVKVESFNHATGGAYQLLVQRAATCGNGVVEGSEGCDGSSGCTASCQPAHVCGNGVVEFSEACDDGNTQSGDGCSSSCAFELSPEVEPNNTAATATPTSPVKVARLSGAISTGADVDWYSVVITAPTDLGVEIFDGRGPGFCDVIDPVVTLYAADGTTVILSRDDGGLNACSKLDPKVDPQVRQLAPGTYFLKVEDFGNNSVIPAYQLWVTRESQCGDGVAQGYERCDGTAGCTASCRFAGVCGDGFVDPGEVCDDGNTTSGDGCSATCLVEHAELEPNDTTTQAAAAAVGFSGPGVVSGAIGVVGDVDLYPLTLATTSVLELELSDPDVSGCASATTLRVLSATGTELYRDDNSGVASCSALTLVVPAGSYFLEVRQRANAATIASYLLTVRAPTSQGAEVEPNETLTQATVLSGRDVVVLGGHQLNLDSDFFRFTVPQGRSVRAEIVEGSMAETCESGGIDSYLTLYAPNGQALGWDDDSGRGACSLIDGTGAVAANPFASSLPAGVYGLQVEASPFVQGGGNAAGQFDYRLVVSVR
jgi:cysteine-rich repeat protein